MSRKMSAAAAAAFLVVFVAGGDGVGGVGWHTFSGSGLLIYSVVNAQLAARLQFSRAA